MWSLSAEELIAIRLSLKVATVATLFSLPVGIGVALLLARGRFAGRTLVGIFRRPDSVAVVWRQAFTVAPGEFVAELVLVQQDGRYRVDHAMVF